MTSNNSQNLRPTWESSGWLWPTGSNNPRSELPKRRRTEIRPLVPWTAIRLKRDVAVQADIDTRSASAFILDTRSIGVQAGSSFAELEGRVTRDIGVQADREPDDTALEWLENYSKRLLQQDGLRPWNTEMIMGIIQELLPGTGFEDKLAKFGVDMQSLPLHKQMQLVAVLSLLEIKYEKHYSSTSTEGSNPQHSQSPVSGATSDTLQHHGTGFHVCQRRRPYWRYKVRFFDAKEYQESSPPEEDPSLMQELPTDEDIENVNEFQVLVRETALGDYLKDSAIFTVFSEVSLGLFFEAWTALDPPIDRHSTCPRTVAALCDIALAVGGWWEIVSDLSVYVYAGVINTSLEVLYEFAKSGEILFSTSSAFLSTTCSAISSRVHTTQQTFEPWWSAFHNIITCASSWVQFTRSSKRTQMWRGRLPWIVRIYNMIFRPLLKVRSTLGHTVTDVFMISLNSYVVWRILPKEYYRLFQIVTATLFLLLAGFMILRNHFIRVRLA